MLAFRSLSVSLRKNWGLLVVYHSVTDIKLFLKVPGNVELHVTAGIVNFTNTLNVDQVTYNVDQVTNNVNLEQTGGNMVLGDYGNINLSPQPPQNCC